MSKRIRVSGYMLSVRKLHARHGEVIGKFNGQEDLGEVLKKLISNNARNQKLNVFGKAYRFNLDKNNSRELSGHIFSGDYGSEAEIYDTDSDTISYNKKKSDAELAPLYFYIATNPNERSGIVCFQQFGTQGIKSVFEATINHQFAARYPEYRIHIKSLTIADALPGYIAGGQVEEVIVEKHEIPSDIADKVAGKKSVAQGTLTYTIKPTSPSFFKKSGLIAYVNGDATAASDFDIGNHGYDVVRTKIRVGETTKTYDLSKPDVLAMSVDITDDVKFGDDGYPTTDTMRRQFASVAADLAKRGNIKL